MSEKETPPSRVGHKLAAPGRRDAPTQMRGAKLLHHQLMSLRKAAKDDGILPGILLVEDDQREDDIFVVNVCIIGPGKSLAFTAKGLSA